LPATTPDMIMCKNGLQQKWVYMSRLDVLWGYTKWTLAVV